MRSKAKSVYSCFFRTSLYRTLIYSLCAWRGACAQIRRIAVARPHIESQRNREYVFRVAVRKLKGEYNDYQENQVAFGCS